METKSTRSHENLLELLEISAAIGGEGDLLALLELILRKARDLTSADAGSIFLVEKAPRRRFGVDQDQDPPLNGQSPTGDTLWFAVSQNASLEAGKAGLTRIDVSEHHAIHSQLVDIRFPISEERLVGWSALTGEALNIPDVYELDPALPYRFDDAMDKKLGYRAVSMLTVPMRLMSGEVVGVLQLINRKNNSSEVLTPENAREKSGPFESFDQALVEALASLAAVSVERTKLLDGQQALLDSIIALMAGAIDAKSEYTGGHCARVPELAMLLAQAAEAEDEGPFANFSFDTPEAWREFRIGAWLHDCGKLTTPEHIVDKATKLETRWNRIHEIRTRFEVLLRDAQIKRLEGLLAGENPEVLDKALADRESELREQFAFIAESNLGAEKFDQQSVEGLKKIANQSWQRHFDDTLGLAWEERELRTSHPPSGTALPAEEKLLSDQPWHRVPRSVSQKVKQGYGFKLNAPENLANFGEIHNLSIDRGTLTDEERFKINDHIIQTIQMLESLPLPSSLWRVPEYAGTHHETLTGKGYPRGLKAEALSIPSRIMAIADIFEALTAADRPYKKAKSLSEAVDILSGFRDRGHIDPDLFTLFLEKGIYRIYAEQFLDPSQIDEVDVSRYLDAAAQRRAS